MNFLSQARRIALIALALAALPLTSNAHSKGLYENQEQAEQRAKEMGCTGTHQNNGKWMPCSNEATLHQHQRHH
ncbi:MAG: DUF3721 domain-containing protein [Cyanobacteria bacterium]|nr:DUF3721 domain-containing protein [Cyanobacteriota bacterium]MDA1247485.1 DUF3721 domain-containing protein [Cyanobacteriota bacterium]